MKHSVRRLSDDTRPGLVVDLTLVVAVGRAQVDLSHFIASIEAQTLSPDRYEVIAVHDGSARVGSRLLAAWQERRPGVVTVLMEPSAGPAEARNRAIDHARGRWVTFPSPEDLIAPTYLAEMVAFLAEHSDLRCASGQILVNDGRVREVRNTHPLRRRFADGNQIADLIDHPDYFLDQVASTFFSAAELRDQELRFDEALGGRIADAAFCARFFLSLGRPVIGLVATASYLAREVKPSLVGKEDGVSGRYASAVRLGLLAPLREGARRSSSGRAPQWLQQLVIYELSWFLSEEDTQAGARIETTSSALDDFHGSIGEVIAELDADTIEGFTARRLKPAWRDILLHGYAGRPWHQQSGLPTHVDSDQGLVRLAYRYTGKPPRERLIIAGLTVRPMHSKTRDISFFGRVLLHERIHWVWWSDELHLELDRTRIDVSGTPRRGPGRRDRHERSFRNRLIARLARTSLAKRSWGDAWVLMDRIGDAQDNGEHLFRFIRRTRPDINAWFVLDHTSHDWRRLRREFGTRIVPHGSLRWKLLMANCRHLASSHADVPVMHPTELLRVMWPRWRFAFLQHGVIHSDLSRWLNPKHIDLLLTSTPAEFASIAGDNTSYGLTTKEVKLTGLPRFDRLLELDKISRRRDLVLVAPTWRANLAPIVRRGSHERMIGPAFSSSKFLRRWLELLGALDLAAACRQHGLTLGFLPHPNLQPVLASVELPEHVCPLTFAGNDIQQLLVRSALVITDYSSIAFDAAFIRRPVVYFQFDRESVLGGDHVGRDGYFDYDRDGFGPVAETAKAAAQHAVELLETREPPLRFQSRMDAAFPDRDGRCRERVLFELERSARRLTLADASVTEPAPLPCGHGSSD